MDLYVVKNKEDHFSIFHSVSDNKISSNLLEKMEKTQVMFPFSG